MPAYINALGVCLPNKPVPNEKVEAVLGRVGDAPSTVRDIILGRNGIRWRYYAIDPLTHKATHTNAQLTAEAIRALVNETGLAWDDIDLLACGTSSPDQAIPNHAAMVHGLLGSPPCEIVSTAGVCCSGMTAMKYAYASVLAGLNNAAVVTGSESASSALKASQFSALHNGHAADHPYVGFNQEFLRFMLSDGAAPRWSKPGRATPARRCTSTGSSCVPSPTNCPPACTRAPPNRPMARSAAGAKKIKASRRSSRRGTSTFLKM